MASSGGQMSSIACFYNVLLELGVGYTGSSLRFLTFIFFSLTYLIVITNSKKFSKNIISKKIPSCFIEWHRAGSIFAPQKPMKSTFFSKRPGIFFEMIYLKDFFCFVISIRYVNEKNESKKFEHLP